MEGNLSNPTKKLEKKKEVPVEWFFPTVGPRSLVAFSPEFFEKFGTRIGEYMMEGNEEEVKKRTGFSIQELKAARRRMERELRKKGSVN
jgi:hypothetical protein